MIKGIQQEIYIIISNIIFNAARYTRNNGVIEIKWFANEQGIHFQVKIMELESAKKTCHGSPKGFLE